MVLSILDVTPVLIEVILRKKSLRQQQRTLESEVHVDTEVDAVVDSDNELRLALRLKLKTKQATPTQLTRNFQTKQERRR